MSEAIFSALSDGMQKPSPSVVPEAYFAVTIPTTFPPESNAGPPEFPELTAASIWNMVIGFPSVFIFLSSALTTPLVSENVSSPRGFPITVMSSPTVISEDFPNVTGLSPVLSIFSTAMSETSLS